jgi:RNA polymerase sigma factor FliA
MATQAVTPIRQSISGYPQVQDRAKNHMFTRAGLCAPANVRGTVRSEWEESKHQNARGQVAAELVPLVRMMALKIRKRLPVHVDLDDLIGSGMLGLLDAVRKFDAGKRVKIESYARHRIRGAILDGLRTLDSATRDARKKNKKVEHTLHDLQMKLGRSASDEEMAGALGLGLKAWHRVISELEMTGVDWLRPMQRIGPKQVSEESLADEHQESQFDLCYRREQRDILNRALTRLSARDRQIVTHYHGRGMTMKQIATRLKIDESRVSQLHSAAIIRLRQAVKAYLCIRRPISHPPGGFRAEV